MQVFYTSYLPTRGFMSASFPHLETLDIRGTRDAVYRLPETHWTHLDCVALPLSLRENLRPTCTVHDLEVYTAITADIAPRFTELLRRMNPRALRLYFHIGENHGEQLQRAPQLWDANHAQKLTDFGSGESSGGVARVLYDRHEELCSSACTL